MALKKARGGWVKKPKSGYFICPRKESFGLKDDLYFYISASAFPSSSDIWKCIVTAGWSTQFFLWEVLPLSLLWALRGWAPHCPSLALTATVCPGAFTVTSTIPPPLTARRFFFPQSWNLIMPEHTSQITKSGWRRGSWWRGFCSGLYSKASKKPCEECSYYFPCVVSEVWAPAPALLHVSPPCSLCFQYSSPISPRAYRTSSYLRGIDTLCPLSGPLPSVSNLLP